MKIKAQVMDAEAIKRSLRRISHEIIEKNKGIEHLALVGIYTRGVTLAHFLKSNLDALEQSDIPIGCLDIINYRDDRTQPEPYKDNTAIPFDVTGKKIILVDDVLYTGRTLRAAIELLFDLGRPQSIQVAVLIDRGHRELPMRADYVGKNLPTSQKEKVVVNLQRDDGVSQVTIIE